ncbi:dihydrofolate reductase family protein [Streptomyces nigrescens]
MGAAPTTEAQDGLRDCGTAGLRDLIVTGNITLAPALATDGLVDEYRLFVHPVALGHGWPETVRGRNQPGDSTPHRNPAVPPGPRPSALPDRLTHQALPWRATTAVNLRHHSAPAATLRLFPGPLGISSCAAENPGWEMR